MTANRYTCQLFQDLPNGDGLLRYVESGIPGGSFLTALLSNNLKETFARADDDNAVKIRQYVQWLYGYAPSGCWGSPERVTAWIKNGGLEGIARADAAENVEA